jgi:hypothetical protein
MPMAELECFSISTSVITWYPACSSSDISPNSDSCVIVSYSWLANELGNPLGTDQRLWAAFPIDSVPRFINAIWKMES